MKIKLIVLVLLVAVFVFGCAVISYPSMFDKGFPPDGRYETLGPVFCEDRTIGILGLVWLGGIKYADLDAEARKKYKVKVGDVVDVINVSVDKEIVLASGLVIIIHTTLRGIAIRYVDSPPATATDGGK